MKLLELRARWLARAWPVLAMLPIVALHHWVLRTWLSHSEQEINRYASAIAQVVGAVVVILSIDENLGLFRRKSLSDLLTDWVRSFPKSARIIEISSHGSMSFGGGAALATIEVPKKPKSVEEQLVELRERIETVAGESRKQVAELSQRVEKVSADTVASIARTDERVQQLGTRLDQAAVGGFKSQIFGVLLAIYGSYVGVKG